MPVVTFLGYIIFNVSLFSAYYLSFNYFSLVGLFSGALLVFGINDKADNFRNRTIFDNIQYLLTFMLIAYTGNLISGYTKVSIIEILLKDKIFILIIFLLFTTLLVNASRKLSN